MVEIITQKEKGGSRHWKNYLDKDYLGSHNLERGEEMLLTIAKFEGEETVKGTDGKEKVKPVLYFKENVPKMIMNITNGNTISSLYGSHPDGWVGKQIQVYATPVKAFGKTQDALRVRDFVPKIEVDVDTHKMFLESASSEAELRALWVKLPVSARNNKEVLAHKDTLKANLTNK
jgi:hypothetical protein